MIYAALIFNNIRLPDAFSNSAVGLLQTVHSFVKEPKYAESAMQIQYLITY